jgi:hypothetical protein
MIVPAAGQYPFRPGSGSISAAALPQRSNSALMNRRFGYVAS